jgi:hypothetical protein
VGVVEPEGQYDPGGQVDWVRTSGQKEPAAQLVSEVTLVEGQYDPKLQGTLLEVSGQKYPTAQSVSTVDLAGQNEPKLQTI